MAHDCSGATFGFSRQIALAQYPNKPVRVVVPYPAGGAVDFLPRA